MGKNQHVVPRGEHDWAVLGASNSRDTSHHLTQKAAMQAARKIAMNQKSEMIVHKVNEPIRQKNSYGNDPCPPRDLKQSPELQSDCRFCANVHFVFIVTA